jgi:triacylglycerol esterase/lipase EstA (alpha/beta hydrolase family)
VTEDETTTTPPTQDEQEACTYLNAGDCGGKEDGTGGLTSLDWRSPEFWADLYLNKFSVQRAKFNTQIEAGPTPLAQPRTVLLVTGVTIRGSWFDGIAARLRRDGFNPVVWEPPALLSGNLLDASHELANVVERVKTESGQSKIDILAECTGGVIARYYIQSMGGDQNISRLVTFVSPQHGLFGAALLSKVVSWPALRDLTPGSAFLNAVNSKSPPASVPTTSIFTCTDEYIQPYTGSAIPGATNINLCNSGPSGFIGHFRTMYDPAIYMIMHDALVK